MNGGVIIIEGNIGAGKSTFASILAEKLNGEYIAEPDEKSNPYMEDYYKDPHRWAFEMQMYLLSNRYRSQKYAQAKVRKNCGGYVVMDRSYYGDVCFAAVQRKLGYFSERDFTTYMMHHTDMKSQLEPPAVALFLNVSPEKSRERISRRIQEKTGRKCEAGIDLGYLQSLEDEILDLEKHMQDYTNVVDLSWNDDLSREQIAEKCDDISRTIRGFSPSIYDYWIGKAGKGE